MNMPEVEKHSISSWEYPVCDSREVDRLKAFTKNLANELSDACAKGLDEKMKNNKLMQDCKELMTELNDCLPILDMWLYEADAESVRELLTRMEDKYD